MKKLSLLYLPLFIILMLAACKKDKDISDITILPPPAPEQYIETSVSGIVTDRDGQPIEAAEIRMGSEQVDTDSFGYFLISGTSSDRRAILEVKKDGYFRLQHLLIPDRADTSLTEIKLTTRELSGQLASSDGGEVAVSNSSSVTFAPDGFVDENGQAYQGAVSVYAHYLDPTDPDLNTYVSGDFTAIDQEEESRLLESYGMLQVELEGESGEPLQIAKPASLAVSVPNALLGSAPAEIPLWYYDEDRSIWVEEGKAVLESGVYTGEVSHFTLWNCDIPYGGARLSGKLKMGDFVVRAKVRLTRQDNGQFRTANTASNGRFSGLVPIGATFLLEVIDDCGNVFYSDVVGPFTTDTDLGDIQLTMDDRWSILKGRLLDCDQNPVENGYAFVRSIPNNSIYEYLLVNSFGRFFALVPNCDEPEISIQGFDRDSDKYTSAQIVPLTDNVDFGDIEVCEDSAYAELIIEYNGITRLITECTITHSFDSNGTSIGTWEVIARDSTPTGVVEYRVNLFDWNTDPTNPLLALAYEYTLFNAPDPYFDFGTIGQINFPIYATTPGSYIEIELPSTTVTERPAVNIFNNSRVLIRGIIQ